jgi:hypothetical protein
MASSLAGSRIVFVACAVAAYTAIAACAGSSTKSQAHPTPTGSSLDAATTSIDASACRHFLPSAKNVLDTFTDEATGKLNSPLFLLQSAIDVNLKNLATARETASPSLAQLMIRVEATIKEMKADLKPAAPKGALGDSFGAFQDALSPLLDRCLQLKRDAAS